MPVFVDIDPKTHNIDASKIEVAIGPKTKAIMLAHSLGNPFDLDVVSALCKKYNIFWYQQLIHHFFKLFGNYPTNEKIIVWF